MKGYHIQNVWKGFVALSIFLCIAGCETLSSDLLETGEDGNVVNNGDINIASSLLDAGMKAYAVDSVYTELILEKVKSATRVTGFRKGIVTYRSNGMIRDIIMSNEEPKLKTGMDFSYSYGNYSYRITGTEDHGFAKYMEVTIDGVTTNLEYHYDAAGYVSWVQVNRPNCEMAYVYFYYNYRNAENPSNSITILEEPGSQYYTIKLADKLSNEGYVCNVLHYADSPLTNDFIINSDLYYMGIYGTPVKYLPDAIIEKGSYRDDEGILQDAISRVGDSKFFYNE